MKIKAYVESFNICSQMCACDPDKLRAHQLILRGAMEFVWGENIFLKLFKKSMSREPNFGVQKYFF